MEEAEEVLFEVKRNFGQGLRIPFLHINTVSNMVHYSVAVVNTLKMTTRTRIKLSVSSKGNVYMFTDTDGVSVTKAGNGIKMLRTSNKPFVTKLVSLFNITTETYRLSVDVIADDIIVNTKDKKQKVVTAYRIFNNPSIQKEDAT